MFIPEIPNNSISKEIAEIVSLAKQLESTRRFEFQKGSLDEEIHSWEKKHQINLPASYSDWLRFSNGSILRGTIAEFYGLDAIEIKPDGFPDDYVIIGTLTGDGELICFSQNNGCLFTDNHGEITEYENFHEILEEVILDIKGMW